MERKEKRIKFFNDLKRIMRENNVFMHDDNFLMRLGSYREWKDPESISKEIKRMQKYRAEN